MSIARKILLFIAELPVLFFVLISAPNLKCAKEVLRGRRLTL